MTALVEMGQCGDLAVRYLSRDMDDLPIRMLHLTWAISSNITELGPQCASADCSFDVIGEITFAKRLGFLRQGRRFESSHEEYRGLPFVTGPKVGIVPEFHYPLTRL